MSADVDGCGFSKISCCRAVGAQGGGGVVLVGVVTVGIGSNHGWDGVEGVAGVRGEGIRCAQGMEEEHDSSSPPTKMVFSPPTN